MLQFPVDGEVDILSRRCGLAAQLADDAAMGIDLHAADAGIASNLFVERFFDAALADAEAGKRQERIGIVLLVFGADGGNVAQHMREFRAEGIGAGFADIGLDAGKIGKIEVDTGEIIPTQIFRHHHWRKRFVFRHIAQDFFALAIRERNEAGDRIDRSLCAARCLLRHQQDAVIAPVVGKLNAEAIYDPAARGRDEALVDAVVFGLRHEILEIEDLQLVEAAGEQSEDARHAACGQQRAAREGRVAAFVLAIEHRHQRCVLAEPTRRRWRMPSTSTAGI